MTNVWLQFLYNNLVVLSWGISQIKQTDSSLRFFVNGSCYKGAILIECLGEKYDVLFVQTNMILKNIAVDDVVRIIDEEVE